jgi:hypothetical protein
MGDSYIASGQIGRVGPGDHFGDVQMVQGTSNNLTDVEISGLAMDLPVLRREMKAKAVEPEHDVAVGEIAKAEDAVAKRDMPRAMQHLSAAGKWALSVAEKVGTQLAVLALKKAMGL